MLLCDVSLDVWANLFELLKPRHQVRLAMTGDARVLYALANAQRECRLLRGDRLLNIDAPRSTLVRQLVMGKSTHLSTSCVNFLALPSSFSFSRLVSLDFETTAVTESEWIRTIALPKNAALLDLSRLTPVLKHLHMRCHAMNFFVRLPSTLERLEIKAEECHAPLQRFLNLDKLASLSSLVARSGQEFSFTFHGTLPPNLTSLSVPAGCHFALPLLRELPASVRSLHLLNTLLTLDLSDLADLPLAEIIVTDKAFRIGTAITSLPRTLTRLKVDCLQLETYDATGVLKVLNALPPSLTDFSMNTIGPKLPHDRGLEVFATILPRLNLAGVLRLVPFMSSLCATEGQSLNDLMLSTLKQKGASEHRIRTAQYDGLFGHVRVNNAIWQAVQAGLSDDDIRGLLKRWTWIMNGVHIYDKDWNVDSMKVALEICRLGLVEKLHVSQTGCGPLPDWALINVMEMTVDLYSPNNDLSKLLANKLVALKRLTIRFFGNLLIREEEWASVVDTVCDHLPFLILLDEVTFVSAYNSNMHPKFCAPLIENLAAHKFVASGVDGIFRYRVSGARALISHQLPLSPTTSISN